MAISGSGETSCMISAIGKIGVRSGGPAGWPVCGFSGGSGSPGGAGGGVAQGGGGGAPSPRTYFVVSLMRAILRPRGRDQREKRRRSPRGRVEQRVRRYSVSVMSSGSEQSM